MKKYPNASNLTEVRIPLKKCSLLVFLCLFQNIPLSAIEKIPFLHKVGALPIQSENLDLKDPEVSQRLSFFSQRLQSALEDAHRFTVLNPQVVVAHWENPEERKKWVAKEEVNGFRTPRPSDGGSRCLSILGLDLPHVGILIRLLSPDGLDLWLQEMDTWGKTDFLHADRANVDKHIRSTLFALLNRLPLDASISAIQGSLLSVTGGRAQGLGEGDIIEILRAGIRTRSPATRAWESFDVQKIGQAKLLEVEETTSVARLVSLVQAGDIAVGDGIQIPTIASRHFFELTENRTQQPGIVELLPPPPPVASAAAAVAPVASGAHAKEAEATPNGAAVSPAVAKAQPTSPSFSQQMESGIETAGNAIIQAPSQAKKLVKKIAEDITAETGLRVLQFSGPFTDSMKILWYFPLNTAGIYIKRHLHEHVFYSAGGGGSMGSTTQGGSYTGYHGDIRAYWEQTLATSFHGIEKWQLGGLGSLEGLSVRGDAFGGFDELQGGVFGGILGHVAYETKGHINEAGKEVPAELLQIPWFAEFQLTPLTLGRIGYGGTQHELGASLGWKLAGGAFYRKNSRLTGALQ